MKEKFLALSIAMKILIIAVPIAVVGGGTGVVVSHINTVHKEASAKEEKLEQEKQDLKEIYKDTKDKINNSILSDEDRTEKLEILTSYKVKILDMTLTDKDKAEFKKFVTTVQEEYDACVATLDEKYASIETTYSSDANEYTKEFTDSVAALTQEYTALLKEGKYQEASNKLDEIIAAYEGYGGDSTVEVVDDKSSEDTLKGKTSASSKKDSLPAGYTYDVNGYPVPASGTTITLKGTITKDVVVGQHTEIFEGSTGTVTAEEMAYLDAIAHQIKNGEIDAEVGVNQAGQYLLDRGYTPSHSSSHGIINLDGFNVSHFNNQLYPGELYSYSYITTDGKVMGDDMGNLWIWCSGAGMCIF